MSRRIFFILLFVLLMISGFVYSRFFTGSPVINQVSDNANNQDVVKMCGADKYVIVTRVIDGDTIVVQGDWNVRLLGINADEKDEPCYDAAKNRLEELVLSKKVFLEKDQTDMDQYGRCLRTVFVESKNVDLQLVQEGLAVARFYPPDAKHKDELLLAQEQAIKSASGCKWKPQTVIENE